MIRICISDDFTVDYDEERAMYRVSILEIDAKTMNECWNEICFDAYKDEAVRHGKWIKTFWCEAQDPITGDMEKQYKHDCSVCGYHTGSQGRYFNYCPNCGARMVGE